MRILAIETSGRHGSLATLVGDAAHARPLRQIVLASDQRTAQILAPNLRSLLAEVGWPASSLQLVAVTVGPGSFTGLRIGVTTAKTLAYATGAEIIGINTLAVLAAQAPPGGPLWTIMDAQREELFVARFDAHGGAGIDNFDTSIVPQDRWLAELQPGDRVIGPALRRLAPRLPSGVLAVPEELWQPTASAVGQLAWRAYESGRRDDVWHLTPNYYRPSAAEEKAWRSEGRGAIGEQR